VDALKIILKYTLGLDSNKYCDYALSGKQAIKMVIGNPRRYNLILMDLNMPEMDGNQTMKAIREHLYQGGFKQPIISAVTGHTE
jgi:CheY-like chemotaxis protein